MKPEPNPIDVHIGQQVCALRTARSIGQETLARRLTMSNYCLDQCEKGNNRFMSHQLHKVAEITGVTICYFFEGIEDELLALGENGVNDKTVMTPFCDKRSTTTPFD